VGGDDDADDGPRRQTMGRFETVCGEMGERRSTCTLGSTIGPPTESE